MSLGYYEFRKRPGSGVGSKEIVWDWLWGVQHGFEADGHVFHSSLLVGAVNDPEQHKAANGKYPTVQVWFGNGDGPHTCELTSWATVAWPVPLHGRVSVHETDGFPVWVQTIVAIGVQDKLLEAAASPDQ